ncbi:bifunctional acetate--CoA ligase family protein/GNAT family N-acetyltransferase [Onishia niordana]|uniref:bifunctional acetate--CoA ligase family protein/GNAT family N-acetyltransferase n=1 Tax=Onishia niordana TaxID=2508711 RepID=UPI00109FE3DD|nr:bifunctional acetate--CoA ligase family protein/GNAT family N-acetyltransferase [Halomonas niordiana]
MSIRNLDALFTPSSIALIGASNRPGSVGAVLAKNLFEGGFGGPVMTVNPHETAIRSTLNYHSVAELPIAPDLAVICTPPNTVPGLVKELGERGCRAAVVITAGFGEGDHAEGQALKQAVLDAARPYLMRIVGPNCLGIMSPHAGINASFAHVAPTSGHLAFVTQSGAVATSVLDWAESRGIGFSHMASLGAMSDVDFGDMLYYLALDPNTHAILLYVEAVSEARKFLSAARMASRNKPVVVVKAGRSDAGAKAAMSHTGALAGADAVYDAAFRRAGMLRVKTLDELFQAVGTLASGVKIKGDRLAVLTNGGGIGVLAVDELAEGNGRLAELSPETLARLDARLPATWSHGNPVDILGDAPGERYVVALEALIEANDADAILIINCPTAVADSYEAAQTVINTLHTRHLPVLSCWLGEAAGAKARQLFADRRLPFYDTPEQAVQAFAHLWQHQRNHKLLMETPPAVTDLPEDAPAKANAIIDTVLADGREVLTEPEASALLAAFSLPVVPARQAQNGDEAAALAAEMGFPAVVKILSKDISHKSDAGGVKTDLTSAEAVRQASDDMLARIRQSMPEARIEGVNVQPMIRRPGAFELILGVAEDPIFGPVILFGQGGTAVEVIGDRVIGLPPLNPLLAREMIERTQIARLLKGYRDRPAVDIEAIVLALVKLSQLVIRLPRVVSLDINPLLADSGGVIALDARVVVREASEPRAPMTIRPYPRELAHDIVTQAGQHYHLRPIRPEDENALVEMLKRSEHHDVRLRFFAAIQRFDHAFAARLTQLDYDREMAFIAQPQDAESMLGAVHLIADPDLERAEFAVMVRSDKKHSGLGYCLMQAILDHARRMGITWVEGEVMLENQAMRGMARELGFKEQPLEEGADSVALSLKLDH